MKYRNIEIHEKDNGYINTKGMACFIDYEICVKSFGEKNGELALLFFLIDYILNDHPRINDNDTISYGLWLLKFVKIDNLYKIYELDDTFESWQEGADNAIYYIEQQKTVCKEEAVEFTVPFFSQYIAISEGVLEGERVQGIRYREPEHMSGWYLTTPKYDGNIANMMVVALQEFVVKRKDLIQFLALPYGYVFEITADDMCQIWRASADPQDN